MPEITSRQREILRRVVEEYVATGEPVGSKALVEKGGLAVSPSTVRNELSELETQGLLTHPHTSAGRVPTESGYRYYASDVLERAEPRPPRLALGLAAPEAELDSALEATTQMLADVTRLLALVSAPPLEAASVRHVEVLLLRPTEVVVVTITSSGDVAKRLFRFEQPVDPGLAAWANEYLNEQLTGVRIGGHVLRRRLDDQSLSPRERAFLDAIRPAFFDLVADQAQELYVGGAASLLDEARADELEACRRLLSVLEKRAAALALVGEQLEPRRTYVRVGEDLEHRGLHEVSLVGASYGLPYRPLGAIGLFGPLRMDYEKAVRAVRAAAFELSRFVEAAYEES